MFCCAIGFIVAAIITIAAYLAKTVIRVASFSGGLTPTKLQIDTARKYKRLKPTKRSFNSYCFPTKFALQPQQIFAGDYLKPGSGHKEMLIFHGIGAGKTCLEIQVGERWVQADRNGKNNKPILLMPASLIPGTRAELRSPCAGTNYISEEERAMLSTYVPGSREYNKIIELSDKRIDSAYHIYSYNRFTADSEVGKVPDAPLIIVDEIQNADNANGVFYKHILEWIKEHPKAVVVVMSGTPIFDSPEELVNIARLLRIDAPDDLTPKQIPALFAGKVSYFAGAPAFTFPETSIKIVKCPMSAFQAKWYRSEIAAERKDSGDLKYKAVPNNFYIKSRQRSNVVFPAGTTGSAGMTELTSALIKSSLATYSCKYAALVRRLRKNKLSFIYSSFTGPYGIGFLKRVLNVYGYVDFAVHGPGLKRYAVFSGEETMREKDRIRAVFNSAENDNGQRLQIVIGSPAIKEGVSLMRIMQVHVLELYWNWSRLAQIFGRAVRYCSHKTLPKEEREVKIYMYAAIDRQKRKSLSSTGKTYTPDESVDMYMMNIADEKRERAEPYLAALIDCAVDRLIHNKA